MKQLPIMLLACMMQFASAQYLGLSPQTITLPRDFGTSTLISDGGGGHVKFKYNGVVTDFNAPNFIVVVPSSGTTPAIVHIGPNPNVVAQLQPGGIYSLSVQFVPVDQPAVGGIGGIVNLIVPKEPPPSISSVVNAASMQPLLSPGALVSILGSHLTGPTLSTNFDATAMYPTSVANTSVTFNGIAAPLVYVSPGQINAIVPYALAGQTSLQVVVRRFDMVSPTFAVPLQDISPGIFTATQNGAGLGAILQQGADGSFTYNSPGNPAPRGAALEIFATGSGAWTPPPQSDVFLFGANFKSQPLSVTIGGQPATVLYAGTLGGSTNSWSVLQVNVVVPDGAASGAQPVVLKIGTNDNAQQNVVMWVQ